MSRHVILYGSQTGQAKSIAEKIFEHFEDVLHQKAKWHVYSMDQVGANFQLAELATAILVCSTTGDGNAPDNAAKFFKYLERFITQQQRPQQQSTSSEVDPLEYTILGLGDTNYSNFCQCGKDLFSKFSRLKPNTAKCFYPVCWADDATGLDDFVEPWLEGLYAAIGSQSSSSPAGVSSEQPIIERLSERVTSSLNHHHNYAERGFALIGDDDETIQSPCSTSDQNALLTLPRASSAFLRILPINASVNHSQHNIHPIRTRAPLPCAAQSADSALIDARILPFEKLTKQFSQKPVYRASLQLELHPEHTHANANSQSQLLSGWNPGDAIGLFCGNNASEVEQLIRRLEFPPRVTSDKQKEREEKHETELLSPDEPIRVELDTNTSNLRARLPDHLIGRQKGEQDELEDDSLPSIRYALTWLCDIRRPPSKAFLRVMMQYCKAEIADTTKTGEKEKEDQLESASTTKVEAEKSRIAQFCSKEGAKAYQRCILEPGTTPFDVLSWFPSCRLPISRMLESLPRLLPRAYSICNTPHTHTNAQHDTHTRILQFAFSKTVWAPRPPFRKRPLNGVCTDWLLQQDSVTARHTSKALKSSSSESDSQSEADRDVVAEEESANQSRINNNRSCWIYLRKNLGEFRLPDDVTLPMILIGPGTGIAPFVGFLARRLEQHREANQNAVRFGPIWLFFGCRRVECDMLFEAELNAALSCSLLTHLCVAQSRADNAQIAHIGEEGGQICDAAHYPMGCRYVQHCLLKHATQLCHLILDQSARVFVCGDANGMAKDVMAAMTTVLEKGGGESGMSRKEAEAAITRMRVSRQYLEDVWT